MGASQLKALAAKYPKRIEVVKYVAGDKEGNDAIAKEIKEKYGRVDTVIANAGKSKHLIPAVCNDITHFADSLDVPRHCELRGKGARDAH